MQRPQVQLRGYLPGDLRAIFALDQVCFEKPFRFSYAEMRRLAEAKNGKTIVAEADNKIVAFCMVSFEKHAGASHAYLSTIDVDPEYRGCGFAHLLMRAAENEAVQALCTAMSLHVFVENAAAIRLYEREGYRRLRTHKDFYGGGLNALVYGKQLTTLAE